MANKNITNQIEELEILSSLTDAFAEIASVRMKKTRNSVVLSRDFLQEIQAIFQELQSSYRSEFAKLARKKGLAQDQKLTLLAHNGRSVAVFLSTNTGLYGNLVKKVFRLFAEDIRKENMEATIVGRLGLNMFKEVFPEKSYSYFDLPDYGSNKNELSELVRHLVQYEKIYIYYGKFRSLVNQSPDKIEISAQTQIEEGNASTTTKYLFEPSLEDLLIFFETEMFTSVFEQAIRESELAKFSSRMLAMDLAGVRINESLRNAKLENSRLTHYISNKKQIEYTSSIVSRNII